MREGKLNLIKSNPSSTSYLSGKTLLITSCLALLIGFYVYHCLFYYGSAVDDAFITFRYARNLSNGLGLVYNLGERIEGYSNFSWLLLVALGIKLGFAPIITAKFLGITSGIGAILCSYSLHNRLSYKPRSFGALLAPLLLATNSFFCYWSSCGLETVFFSFLLILSVLLYIKENQKSYPLSAFILGLLLLSRPEGVGYVAVFIAFDLSLRLRHKQVFDRYFLRFYGVILLVLSCYLGFKWIYFGSLFPNTYYAKVVYPFQNFNSSYAYLKDFYLEAGFSLPLMLIVSLAVCLFVIGRRVLLLISLLVFNWFYIIYVLFDWMQNYRYHMYTAPVLFTIIALGLSGLIRLSDMRNRLFGLVTGAVVVLVMGYSINDIVGIKSSRPFHRYYIDSDSHVKKSDRWLWSIPEKIRKGVRPGKKQARLTMFLIENSTPDMTVGMRDIGFPGFITNCRVYDRDMLIHKEARDLSSALRSKDEESVSAYIFGEMRNNLARYNPDLFLYPRARFISMDVFRWDLLDRMYNSYFEDNMELVLEKTFLTGKTSIAYYKKKGLTYKPSLAQVIRKYESIVREYPDYPAFQRRLDRYSRKFKAEKEAVNY